MSSEAFDPSLARRTAESYESFFVPGIGRPVAADPVASAGLRPGERVLDVACGTGIVARPASAAVAPDGSFDVALCGMGLQFFSDRTGRWRTRRGWSAPSA